MEKDKYLMSSVSNTLDIVDLLSKHEEMGVAEICKELDMGKASVFRMLYTLEKKDFVHKTSNAKYKLGVKFAHYGTIVLERQNILSAIKPYLQKLRDEHNETAHMSILDDDFNIIFMGKEMSNSTIQMTSRIGARMASYCTGTGKVLLASLTDEELEKAIESFEFVKRTNNTIIDKDALIKELDTIRRQGYAEDFEESEIGLICYAAPVKDITGKTIAAISISGPSVRMRQNRGALVDSIKSTAMEISKEMGYNVK